MIPVATQSPAQYLFSPKGKHCWDHPTAWQEKNTCMVLDVPAWNSYPKYRAVIDFSDMLTSWDELPLLRFPWLLGCQVQSGLGVPAAYAQYPAPPLIRENWKYIQ